MWKKVSDWQFWKCLSLSTKKCTAQGAGIKASTAMFLSSDLKGLPSAHYSPWLVTRVPISTAKCNDGFSDVDASLLETGTMKLISNSPLKSHQMVTTFSHRLRLALYWQCRNKRLYIILPIPQQSSYPSIIFLGRTDLTEIHWEIIKKNVTEIHFFFLRSLCSILILISFKYF